MHNALHRIYTYHKLAEVLTGEYEDAVVNLLVETDDAVTMYRVGYPYFRKPDLLYYDSEDDDASVDMYGYPIK